MAGATRDSHFSQMGWTLKISSALNSFKAPRISSLTPVNPPFSLIDIPISYKPFTLEKGRGKVQNNPFGKRSLFMNKKDLKKFQTLLEGRRDEIMAQAEQTKENGIAFDPEDLPDEVDLASSEADQSMNLRLRDRERVLYRKIEKALKKIEAGEYGVCESCGE